MARILIIDDDEAIRHFVRQLLEESGHQVRVAEDGDTGARHYRSEPVDLVVTDLEMPNRCGLEVIAELKADYPATRIIAITGAPQDTVDRALHLGTDFVFFKPFTVRGFLEAVDTLTAGLGAGKPGGGPGGRECPGS